MPYTVLNRPGKKTEFRKKAESYLAASANVEAAKNLLKEAGITASDYEFSITVASYKEDHIAMAELAKAAWKALGFKVDVKVLKPTEVMETTVDATTGVETTSGTDVWANPYKTALETGDFEVIALDLVATSADAFSVLAPFAKAFSGNAINLDTTVNPNYELTPHITGYDSEAYNAKIEEAFTAAKSKDRATKLHEAEAILMNDLPVIPVVYNQNAALASKKLGKIESNFFCNADFTKTKLSGYWKIALRDEFVKEEDTKTES